MGHVTIAKLSKLQFRRSQKDLARLAGTGAQVSQLKHEIDPKTAADASRTSKEDAVTCEEVNSMKPKSDASSNKPGKRIWSFPEESYKDFLNIDAGNTTVPELHLCRMQGRESGSYYPIEARIPLNE